MKPIAMLPVESSRITEIGHDAESKTLAIRFKGKDGGQGPLYHYENFSVEQFDNFSGAKSKGSFFGANIANAAKEHPYTRIEEKKKDE